MGVVFEGVSIEEAPTFSSDGTKPIKLSFRGSRTLQAERDLRAWQALLAPYEIIDINFDDRVEEFKPESESERAQIKVHSFTSNIDGDCPRQNHEFAILGRSFLAIDRGIELIESMAFFIEARNAQRADRIIDAYNYFYLFLESKFRLKHKNVEAARQLAGLSDFVGAVESVLSDPFGKTLVSEAKLGLEGWSIDRVSVALQIVELRGQLRHHSIGNPSRWKLSEQQRYRPQSVFLGSVCQHIAMPMSFGLTWEDQYTRGFMEQAESVGFITEVAVLLTINEGALPREVALNFRFPQYEASPLLAKTVLEHSMAEFDKRSPGSQLLGIRARVKPNGPELFRYDLGPAIRR